jgi:DNA-binding MltR family transcriptional regulator
MPRNRGKKAREKRELTTRELSMDERNALLDAMLTPPLAISYAIIGALLVEDELELSIKSRLRKISQQEWESILADKDGPLGNFDRKIKFASYLGILDADMQTNLDIIRNVRNRFAHTKRLISFDHSFIADELAKMAALKGVKRGFHHTSKFAPQWRYISLCLHSIRAMSKKRFGARDSAHKALMKRRQKRVSQMGGLLGLLSASAANSGLRIPVSTLQHQMQKTDSGPSETTPLGLLAGLSAYFEPEKKH